MFMSGSDNEGVPARKRRQELAEKIRSARPDTPVLFMSGYTDRAVFRHSVLQDGEQYVRKPFPPRSLAEKVNGTLA